MATLTLHIDKRNKAYKSFMEYLHSLSFVEIEEPEKLQPNKALRKAIKDANTGNTRKYSNSKELFDKLGI